MGVQALLLGSQIITSPPTIQAAMDVIDSHSYWASPQFPDEPWDPVNWYIDNESVVFSPPGVVGEGNGGGMAGSRVAGKPHLATETNHQAPYGYAAEGPLLTAAYAALQDMDGIFFFDWGAGDIQGSASLNTHTDDAAHSAKLVNMPVAARMFRDFDVSRASTVWTVAMDPETELTTIFEKGRAWNPVDASSRGFPMEAAAIGRVEMDVSEGATDSAFPDVSGMTTFVSDTNELTWNKTAGIVTIDTAKTRALIGFTDGMSFGLGGPGSDCTVSQEGCVVFEPGDTLLGFSTVSLSLTEGDSFTTGDGRALLSAAGNIRNTGMTWTDETMTSLGDQWGTAPVRVEVIPARVTLPRPASEVRVFALDGRGQRIAEVAVTGGDVASFDIGETYSTLWYEVLMGEADPLGEGDRVMEACAAYCGRVMEALPDCYDSTRECLEDCDWWAADALGKACDCNAEVDALFACDEASDTASRVCGRLSQSIPPSTDCIDAYMEAFVCADNPAACIVYEESLVDDFEDGDTVSGRQGFSSWGVQDDGDAATTISPDPFIPRAHGANGSLFAAHVEGEMAQWAQLYLAAASVTVDLSDIIGIAFTAKGKGTLRFSVGTKDMTDVDNYDSYGMLIYLTPAWRRYIVHFDDPKFTQAGSGNATVFNPDQVDRLIFNPWADSGPFDFAIDDVVLLKAKSEPWQG